MRSRRILTLLFTSLVLAGLAAWYANRWLQSKVIAESPVAGMGSVVAAAIEIPFGSALDPTHVKVILLPEETIPERSFSNPEEVIGRVAVQTLYPGEILLDGRVVEHGGGSALSAVIPKGKRALTVRVNDVVGVAGFLLPGNRVDILATRRDPMSRETLSETLLQDLKVLAVDQTASPDKNEPVIVRAVTLEATPQQAEEIVEATAQGKLQLTLRNPLDLNRLVKPEPETPAAEPLAEATPEPVTVEKTGFARVIVIRGTAVSKADISI